MLPLKHTAPKNSKPIKFCAYRVDYPVIVVVAMATALGIVIEKVKLTAAFKKPSPFTIYLLLFLAVDLAVIIPTAIQGTLFPQADNIQQLLEDPTSIGIYSLGPVMVAIGFRFYEGLYTTFGALIKHRIILGTAQQRKEFIRQMDKRCNSRLSAGICIGVSLLLVYLIQRGLFPNVAEDGVNVDWWNTMHIGLRLYLCVWLFMAWYAIFSFVWKVLVVWRTIDTLVSASETDTGGMRFSVNLHYPDGCAGFGKLSQLWLNVNYEIVFLGILAFIHLNVVGGLGNPQALFNIVCYVLLAPLLFFTPFLRLHSLMASKKEDELEKCLLGWRKARRAGSEHLDRWRKQYETAKNLPSWPFGWRFSSQFWGPYLLAPVLSLAIEGISTIARA